MLVGLLLPCRGLLLVRHGSFQCCLT
jgi:hypothetical protein